MQNEIPHALASLPTKLMSKRGIIGRMRPGGRMVALYCSAHSLSCMKICYFCNIPPFLYPEEKFPE